MAFREEAIALEALAVPALSRRRRWLSDCLTFARRKPLGAFGAVVLILTIAVGVFSPWIARFPYTEPHFVDTLQSPNSTYWFGTDVLGQDFFSRIVIGSQVTVLVGLGTVIVAAVLSLVGGGGRGYFCGGGGPITPRVGD